MIQIRIINLKRPIKRSISIKATSTLQGPTAAKTMCTVHYKYVVVPADKATKRLR